MATRQRLYKHRWGQALVEKEIQPAGARVVKNYGKCGFPGTLIYGRVLPLREYRALRCLAAIDGIPQQAKLQKPYTVSYNYIEGMPLRYYGKGTPLPQPFFRNLWELTENIHHHGFVHLDLGNRGNILVRDNGKPAIIDYASSTPTRHFPGWLRDALEKRDRLGVLKLWRRYSPETMPPILIDYFSKNYRKNLATPTRLYRETRRCLKPQVLHGECGHVRRVWITISVALSIAATAGLLIR